MLIELNRPESNGLMASYSEVSESVTTNTNQLQLEAIASHS